MPKKKKFRPFDEARAYAQGLQLKSLKEWYEWAKRGGRPEDIPAYPNEVYKKDWNGSGDFLGTGTKSNNGREYRSFNKAREFARTLQLKSQKEWLAWAKSGNKPEDIPSHPHLIYKEKGWEGLGDFLGTKVIASQNREFRCFDKARAYAQGLQLKSSTEWRDFSKNGGRPEDIPGNPNEVYEKEWAGWGDFLGTGTKSNNSREFRCFDKARAYAQGLQLESSTEWRDFSKNGGRPEDIPANPDSVYNNEWVDWGNFLGTGTKSTNSREFRCFDKARAYAQGLQLKSSTEWHEWSKGRSRPEEIPGNPAKVYKKEWNGYADFLGYKSNGWSVTAIRAFIKSLIPHVDGLTPPEMYVLLQQNGLLSIDRSSKGKKFVEALKSGKFPKEELKKFSVDEVSLVDDFVSGQIFSIEEQSEDLKAADNAISENQVSDDQHELPLISVKNTLTSLDDELLSNLDEEAVDYFIKSAVAKIWKHAYLDEKVAMRELNHHSDDGLYIQKVKSLFLDEYNGAKQLQIPGGYSSPLIPNLMQRHTAYLVKDRKRLGNWSGTGAGKTLSAILASRVVDSKLTIICCPNSVIPNWEKRIHETYPDSLVLSKSVCLKEEDNNSPQYLILNYEFFQQPNAKRRLKALLDDLTVEFVIVDEIHYSKQREVEKMSKRKEAIMSFLSEAAAKNTNLYVLGMSATPVINNLFEGKTLIELVTGLHHDDLQTSATVPNCIALYKSFVSHGLRWLPNYHYKLNLLTEDIDCSSYLTEIREHSIDGTMLDLEITLTKAKLPYIIEQLKPKTIIYTHYVDGVINVLQDAIEHKGWKTGVFTGENKDGLDGFLKGNTDVLIASSCIGTGVDGLQEVSNRLIINSLPWTHAGFQQLKGRIYRQGQVKKHVDIIVPLTYANINGKKWSWCESRWKRILFKKSIADAAVDGLIPEGHLRTPAQAYKDAMSWINRLERGEIYKVERKKILIPLIDEITEIKLRKIGDLVQMNARINQAKSSDTNLRFTNNPDEWEHYHAIYREERKNWPVIPYKKAIEWLKDRPQWVVGDFGCGEALIASETDNEVISFDHVAINENVTACDMSHVPLDEFSLDAVVFSLSLMGSNFIDYLREAHRCLKLDGQLWISEPTSRLQEPELFLELLYSLGFDCFQPNIKSKFTFIRAIKTVRDINEEKITELTKKKII